MGTATLKEIRPIMVTEKDFELFDGDFRTLCAFKNQTTGERIAEIMKADLAAHKAEVFADAWISQQDLIDELEKKGKSVSRQTLRNHSQEWNASG